MPMIEVTRDVKNILLARRELTCTFKGLAGKLKKPEAVDMVSKQFSLDGKVIVPIILKNETGRPMLSGIFYIYDDEKLARLHLKPAIFSRSEKAKGAGEKVEGEITQTQAKKPEEKRDAKEPKETKESKKEEKKAEEKPKEKEETK